MTETISSVPPQVAGEPAPPPPTADYWGVDEFHEYYLPDGVQYFRFKIMNEGDKTKFEKMTNQDLIVNRDQSARVRVDPSEQRHTLIKTSVVGWHLYKDGQFVDFNTHVLEKWLTVAPPKIVEQLEFAIREANPWMQAEMTLEGVDEELERLHRLRQQIVDREAGEAVSATK